MTSVTATMVEVEDKLSKALAEAKAEARRARDDKATGQITVTMDVQSGGITQAKVGFVRVVK